MYGFDFEKFCSKKVKEIDEYYKMERIKEYFK